MKQMRFAIPALAGPRWDAAVAALFSVFLFAAMHMWVEPFAALAALLAAIFCIGRTPWRLGRERLSVPALGFVCFMLIYGAAAVWSPFSVSAVRDFRSMLPAFAVAALLLLRIEKRQVRGVLWGFAAICALVSLLCTSFATNGLLYNGFCSLMDLFFNVGRSYREEIQNTVGRVNGIYNDANVSGSILAFGTLVSLYLVQTGTKWWKRLLACVLVSTSAVGILLSVSRGAILCFGVSLLVWLLAVGKEDRLRLFWLMVISAGVSLAAMALAMPAIGPGALLPNVAAVVSGGLIFLLDRAAGERLTRLLTGHGSVVVIVIGGIAAAGVVFVIAALNVTGPYEFSNQNNSGFMRSLPLEPGEYAVIAEGDFGEDCRVNIYKTSYVETVTEQRTVLYDGPLNGAAFTVPEDSTRVFFTFRGDEETVLRSVTLSDGTKVPLEYKLLPTSIVDRLQRGIFTDNSFLLRVQFMKDAVTIFLQSPIWGRGLGSTDNLYPSVQPYYYTSRYVHNHILQFMSDMGLLGLISYLVFACGSLWLLIRQLRKTRDPLAAVLAACWVMMNTHCLMEINFSVQSYQCAALLLLLLPVLLYGEPLPEKAAKAGGAAACVIVWVYLAVFGCLYGLRQRAMREYSSLKVSSMEELMSSLERLVSWDVFEPENYTVPYVMYAVQDSSGQFDGKMLEYVDKLRNSGYYPACGVLARSYYLPVRDMKGLFACSRECMLQRTSYADVWNEEVQFYRGEVLPTAGKTYIDDIADGVVAFQALLNEVNQDRIEEVRLSEKNQAFLDLVAEAVEAGYSGESLYDYLMYVMERDGLW